MRIRNIFFFLMLLGFMACHDDLDVSEDSSTDTPGPEIINEIKDDIIGYVYDESQNPVQGVQVSIYSNQVVTDINGVFTFRNVELDPNGTYIKAVKNGYVFGSDMVYPKDGESHSLIQLMQLSQSPDFMSTAGGTVELDGGGTVTFPANGIVLENGDEYIGEVVVTAKRIATDDPQMADLMPGGLVAMDNEGATRVLGTIGMAAIELRSTSGQELNLADGVTATIQFQVTTDQLVDAPAEIPLWFFDEDRGLWIEEGKATLNNGFYEGEVAHFSFWNCDAPFPLIHLCGQILCSNGEPATWFKVLVVSDIYGAACGYTDGNGVFCGKVPKNSLLTIEVSVPGCPDITTSVSVGPFSENVELDDIIINKESVIVSGIVECIDVPVSEGYIIVTVDGQQTFYNLNEDGTYSINVTNGCASVEEAIIQAYNSQTGEASSPVTLDLTMEDAIELNLNTCNECGFELTIDQTLSGNCLPSTLTAVVTGGSGDFSYLWDNGVTTATNNPIVNDEVTLACVTVTDDQFPDCEMILCEEVLPVNGGWVEAQITLSSCEENNGSIELVIGNWTEPVTIEWGDSSGGVIGIGLGIENLLPGIYGYQLEDANGCAASESFFIEDSGGIGMEYEIFGDCGQTTVIPFPYGGAPPYVVTLVGTGEVGEEFVFTIPGEYCFDVEDSNGCLGNQCITVWVSEEPVLDYNITCNGFVYIIEFINNGNDFYWYEINGETISNQVYTFDILEFGFEFQVTMFSEQGNCSITETVTLPFFEGLMTTANPASCDTCPDGWIGIDLNADALPNGVCNDCVVEDYIIIDVDGNDVTMINNGQELLSGTYTVGVLDENGCIVAFEIIDL